MRCLLDFSIVDTETGVEIANDLNARRIWNNLLEIIKEGELLLIDHPRSVELIFIIHVCLERGIPFSFDISYDISFVKPCWVLKHGQLHQYDENAESSKNICYKICTSGTTGLPKFISVHNDCIWPNIQDFRERFGISSSDKILFLTSIHFDPSIIELFTSMETGANLILVADDIRSKPAQLGDIIIKYRPSIVQMTPALLSLLSDDVLTFMLGALSSIRILLIGGDMFPLSLVNRFRHALCPTRIFDCYGVTEVSCWATVFEICFGCKEIVLGEAIKNTNLSLSEEQELIIGGSRSSCYINGNKINQCFTGDLVKITSCGWRILGRKDNQIKIRGVRCHLDGMLGRLCEHFKHIRNGKLMVFKKEFLILFLVSNKRVSIEDIASVFPQQLLPAQIYYLDSLPVTGNGKIDLAVLKNLCGRVTNFNDSVESFLSKRKIKKEDIDRKSFKHYGLNSLDAAELALLLGSPEALKDILTTDDSMLTVLGRYHVLLLEKKVFISKCQAIQIPFKPYQLISAYNLKKCIDGSPIIARVADEDVVIASAHSGIVTCLSIPNFFMKWEINLNTRIEASPSFYKFYVCIGGFNSNVYFLNVMNGEILWIFSCNDVLKGSAVFDYRGDAYIVSYDSFLYKLQPERKRLIWSYKLSSGSSASPVLVCSECYIICTTIKGTVEIINSNTGNLSFSYNAGAPIFSSISFSPKKDEFYLSTVKGSVQKIELALKHKTAEIDIGEAIFSSPFLYNSTVIINTQKGSIFILDSNLIYLRSVELRNNSFVKSVFNYSEKEFAMISTRGHLITFKKSVCCDLSSQSQTFIFHYCQLAVGQIFSHPCLTSNNNACLLVIGSRDDWLRCWRK